MAKTFFLVSDAKIIYLYYYVIVTSLDEKIRVTCLVCHVLNCADIQQFIDRCRSRHSHHSNTPELGILSVYCYYTISYVVTLFILVLIIGVECVYIFEFLNLDIV